MVPFKDCFAGTRDAPAPRVTTAQKCLRVGGKHNDLDNVGRTPRHHTFFEMLGNFSFGGYFKEEAVAMAWHFVTQELQLDRDRLMVMVHQTDQESEALWRKLGMNNIQRLGDEDNLWTMGDGPGPIGRCTEIFYDMKPSDPSFNDHTQERYLEIWNLVFMEQMQQADGSRVPLPGGSCVDTGMGLERVASVMQ